MSANQCSSGSIDGMSVGQVTGGALTTNCGGGSGVYPYTWYSYPSHVSFDYPHRDFASWLRGFMEGKKSLTQAEMQTLRERMQLLG